MLSLQGPRPGFAGGRRPVAGRPPPPPPPQVPMIDISPQNRRSPPNSARLPNSLSFLPRGPRPRAKPKKWSPVFNNAEGEGTASRWKRLGLKTVKSRRGTLAGRRRGTGARNLEAVMATLFWGPARRRRRPERGPFRRTTRASHFAALVFAVAVLWTGISSLNRKRARPFLLRDGDGPLWRARFDTEPRNRSNDVPVRRGMGPPARLRPFDPAPTSAPTPRLTF